MGKLVFVLSRSGSDDLSDIVPVMGNMRLYSGSDRPERYRRGGGPRTSEAKNFGTSRGPRSAADSAPQRSLSRVLLMHF